MSQTLSRRLSLLWGLLGALAGGAIGHVVFFWLVRQGYYAMVMPPALVGLGAGLAVRHRSAGFATGIAALALAQGLFIEWRFAPFIADGGLGYFLTHLHLLRPLTLMLLALGTAVAWFLALGWGRPRP